MPRKRKVLELQVWWDGSLGFTFQDRRTSFPPATVGGAMYRAVAEVLAKLERFAKDNRSMAHPDWPSILKSHERASKAVDSFFGKFYAEHTLASAEPVNEATGVQQPEENSNDADPGEHAAMQGYADLQEQADRDAERYDSDPQYREYVNHSPGEHGSANFWRLPEKYDSVHRPEDGPFTEAVTEALGDIPPTTGEPKPDMRKDDDDSSREIKS